MNLYSIISLFLFIPVTIISFYIPGFVIIDYLIVKISRFEKTVLSFFVGIALFLLTSYILAWVSFEKGQYLILLGFLGVFLYRVKGRKLPKFKLNKFDYLLGGIVLVCSVLYSTLTFFSGWMNNGVLQFIGVNEADGLVHVSRIKNFADFFPPQHPGLAEVPFRGYHYFYDFLLSQFHELFRFSVNDLYFRNFSIFISILFGVSLVFVSRQLKFSKLAAVLAIILAFLTPGLVMLPKFFFHKEITLSILGPGNYIFDPSMILGVAILLIGISLLPKVVDSWKLGIIVGLLLGILAQIKVYTGLIGIIVVCVYGLYLVIKSRSINQKSYIVMGLITALLTTVSFLPNNFGSGSFVWAPFLFYEHFMRQIAFQDSYWEVKRRIFLEHNNLPRLILMYTQAIGLFMLYAVGIKLVVFAKTLTVFKKKFWENDYNIILFTAILFALLIPTFFIQSVSVFDIGQFFAVSILVLSIPAAYVVSWLYTKNKIIGLILIGIVITLSSIEMFQVQKRYLFAENPLSVSRKEIAVYDQAGAKINKQDFIVSIPETTIVDDKVILNWYKPSLVSAMTGRSVYFEDEIIQNPKTERTRKNREQDVVSLAEYIRSCSVDEITRKLDKIGTVYMVTQKPENCLKQHSNSSIESSSVSFYEMP